MATLFFTFTAVWTSGGGSGVLGTLFYRICN